MFSEKHRVNTMATKVTTKVTTKKEATVNQSGKQIKR